MPSTTSGEADIAHVKLVALASAKMFVRHPSAPVAASRLCSSPVAPSANSRPSSQVGVARGPSPPIILLKERLPPVRPQLAAGLGTVVGGHYLTVAALLDGEQPVQSAATNEA